MPVQPWKPYEVPAPQTRKLKVFAFDPAVASNLETTDYGVVTLIIGYEPLQPGPVGSRLEVIDDDPGSGCYYEPVDLEHKHLVRQDGLEPSEGNPLFHQQMCYAVAMSTIEKFEHALGRTLWWRHRIRQHGDDKPLGAILGKARHAHGAALGRLLDDLAGHAKESGGWEKLADELGYVPRLRMYPHGLRERNAYYDPERRSVNFGYFPADSVKSKNYLPGGMVFTCLSHDVIAHEMTHALLDATAPKLLHASNDDVFAFHEAFADLVAIFQRFQLRDVVQSQITASGGDLRSSSSLLDKLALQFGLSTGQPGALREVKRESDVNLLDKTLEPHWRGNILVSAVYDAFLAIYETKTADLRRIASDGTGILRPGSLNPDLACRLADEATLLAQTFLNICVRALDYMPPVDVSFGDFLRAIVTADADLVPRDEGKYRRAVVQAFREWGIYPRYVNGLGEDIVRWKREDDRKLWEEGVGIVRAYAQNVAYRDVSAAENFSLSVLVRTALHESLGRHLEQNPDLAKRFGLLPPELGIKFEVEGMFPVERIGPDGQKLRHFIVRLAQQCRIDLTTEMIETKSCLPANFTATIEDPIEKHEREANTVVVRGGATLIFDGERAELLYSIRKNILNQDRWAERKAWEEAKRGGRRNTSGMAFNASSPFAFLHRGRTELLSPKGNNDE